MQPPPPPRIVPPLIHVSPLCSYADFLSQCVASRSPDGELVIADDLPHIAVMRAGIHLGFTFSIEERGGVPRLVARR